MSKLIFWIFTASCLSVMLFSFRHASEYVNDVPYPDGYRNWVHVKSRFAGPKSADFQINGGFNHTYANDKALTGYLSGNFPEGSIIVFDVLIVQEDSVNHGIVELARKRIDVMIKDSAKYAATGGWGYGQFKADHRDNGIRTLEAATKCFACHMSQKDLVFSDFRK
jgi:hypothetical protein